MKKVNVAKKPNTYIHHKDGFTVVRLYRTNIFGISKNQIFINFGGFETPTTTNRINQSLEHFAISGKVFTRNSKKYFFNGNINIMLNTSEKNFITRGI